MATLRLLHRWLGGFVGLLLALLGLTGTPLLHKEAWLRATLPHATDARIGDPYAVGAALGRLFAEPSAPRSVLMASDGFGLHRLSYPGGSEAGAYATQAGEIVERWTGKWDRLEIWLFDLHHHLLLKGETGDTIAGVGALIGLGFVITGVILWWPSRRLFALRLLPRRLSRAEVVAQHRDLGVVAAPLLAVSLLTGAAMTVDPVSDAIVHAFSPPDEVRTARAAPPAKGGPLSPDLDWAALIRTAQATYPDGEVRLVAVPVKPGELISMRMRREAEWLPNGRTLLWFDPADGRLVAHRDALALPLGLQVANAEYPIHAAKVGGLPYRLVMTVSGLALTLLGSLAVVTFWGNPSGLPRRRRGAVRASPPLAAE